MKVAAIDQGTTSTRALVIAEGKMPEVVARHRQQQFYPQAGWVEHNPNELLAHIRACLIEAGTVDAIAIANQGESCLAWDALTGEPLSPVIVWQDMRTAPALAEWGEMQRAKVLASSGLPADAYFSASKLAWLLKNCLPVAAAHHAGRLRLGTTDAFFLHNLAGHCVTDITTASRTGLMNIETLDWDAELCAVFGVPLETLPPIVPSMGDFGSINGIPVRASMVDQQAALYGHGCRLPGDAKVTFGTGAFVLAVSDHLVRAPERGILPTIGWSGPDGVTRAVDGGVYDAGSAVEWAKRLGLFSDFAELEAFDRPAAISRNLACVPALSGLAAPHWDRHAGSLFIGMTADTDKRDLCQALLEGIAFLTADVVAALDAETPLGPKFSVDGGLSQSRYFRQVLANATGRTIVTHTVTELTCVGLAQLAAGGALDVDLGQRTEITPEGDWSQNRARFAAAVSKSKGWRAS
ncbi:glycerol kinase [Devosia riboflavina]|uniref:ATP:glycerol 3-phosphotransferase n=1 Tax=Devosia riboflavina TaxID=46914 RepID=A0A087M320_9HYPH|nr:FGGY family carbohydrate kinase [Devosia riboflavina]KFL31273.1 glycerol kinase [Devosia riboflavina]